MTTPWLTESAAIVLKAMAGRDEFTADDLHPILAVPSHPNQFGSLLKELCRSKKISLVGFTQSKRIERNGGILRKWKVGV